VQCPSVHSPKTSPDIFLFPGLSFNSQHVLLPLFTLLASPIIARRWHSGNLLRFIFPPLLFSNKFGSFPLFPLLQINRSLDTPVFLFPLPPLFYFLLFFPMIFSILFRPQPFAPLYFPLLHKNYFVLSSFAFSLSSKNLLFPKPSPLARYRFTVLFLLILLCFPDDSLPNPKSFPVIPKVFPLSTQNGAGLF